MFCFDVACFKHGVSREYAQKLRHYFPKIDDAGVEVVGVSLGTVDAAKDFCSETGFPLDNMFMVSLCLGLWLSVARLILCALRRLSGCFDVFLRHVWVSRVPCGLSPFFAKTHNNKFSPRFWSAPPLVDYVLTFLDV